MADEDVEEGAAEAAAAEAGSGSRRWWIIGAGVLLVLLSSGLTLWFLLATERDDVELDADAEVSAEQPAPARGSALYFPLRPAFVVDFEHRGRLRYLQVSITLMARDPAVIEAVQLHMPLIRNRVVLLLGGEDFEVLQTSEGRELLRLTLLQAIQVIMQEEIGQPGVEQVLFTNFVMQ